MDMRNDTKYWLTNHLPTFVWATRYPVRVISIPWLQTASFGWHVSMIIKYFDLDLLSEWMDTNTSSQFNSHFETCKLHRGFLWDKQILSRGGLGWAKYIQSFIFKLFSLSFFLALDKSEESKEWCHLFLQP